MKREQILECAKITKTKSLEKNPKKGGTPANERILMASTLVKKEVDPKLDIENIVLKFAMGDCSIVVKKINEVKL